MKGFQEDTASFQREQHLTPNRRLLSELKEFYDDFKRLIIINLNYYILLIKAHNSLFYCLKPVNTYL